MARSRAESLGEALRLLESVHGRVAVIRGGSPMDFIMGLLLSANAPEDRAVDAIKRLTSEFADWNEIRISYRREVSAVLKGVGYEDAGERVETILQFLGRLYKDKNGVDLAFIASMEPEAVYSYFRAFPQIKDPVAAALTATLREDGVILDIPEIIRTAQRIGLGGSQASPAKVRKVLEDTAKGDDRVRLHYYFVLHATDGPCRARSPQCAECGAASCCDHGRAAAKAAGKSAKAATPKKAPAPGKKKAEPKKAAKPEKKESRSAPRTSRVRAPAPRKAR